MLCSFLWSDSAFCREIYFVPNIGSPRFRSVLLFFAALIVSAFDGQDLTARAEAGDPTAQRDLGYGYLRGKNVEQDYEKAFHWYSRAADAGDPRAMVAVSRLYRDGLGVRKNEHQARLYREHAVERARKVAAGTDFAYVEEAIAWYFRPIGLDGTNANYVEELAWHRKAAMLGSGFSKLVIGAYYEFGMGVSRDRETAAIWYREAGLQGINGARERFCNLFMRTDLIPKTDPQAVEWCK